VAITVRLRTGFPLGTVESASHPVDFFQEGDALRVELSPSRGVAGRDFLLGWTPRLDSRPSSFAYVEEHEGQRYAMIVVLPPDPRTDSGLGLATETLFVVDVSGSMQGPSIEQAREALAAAVRRLRPEDRFNILAFNEAQQLFLPEPRHADELTVESALAWIGGLRADGGTLIHPALMRAVTMMDESAAAHGRRIVFLTDGAVANEAELLDGLARRLRGVRLHTIGIGSAPNTYLMRKMAGVGLGLSCFIADRSRAGATMERFLERLERPVMEAVRIDFEAAGLEQVLPDTPPDLHAGRPLVISAKLAGDGVGEPLRVGGYTRDGWSERGVGIRVEAAPDSGVAYRWARARVESLMDLLHEGADPAMVRDEVLALALRFGLVTRYTSLVAVEQRPTALGDARTLRSAAVLPAGGTTDPLKRRVGAGLALLGLVLFAVSRRAGWIR
jgi:Ca-activated chloride channel family protein